MGLKWFQNKGPNIGIHIAWCTCSVASVSRVVFTLCILHKGCRENTGLVWKKLQLGKYLRCKDSETHTEVVFTSSVGFQKYPFLSRCTLRWWDVELVEHVKDTVFEPSVCISPASYSASRCNVFKCITLCFKVSLHNLWPPTLQHWLSRCLNMLHIARPTVNKHREMNCMPSTVFISFVSCCSLVHHYQTALSLVEYFWNAWMAYRAMEMLSAYVCLWCVCIYLCWCDYLPISRRAPLPKTCHINYCCKW